MSNNFHTVIYDFLINNKELTSSSKLIWIFLFIEAKGKPEVTISHKVIINKIGASKKTVYNSIMQLSKLNLLQINKSNIYSESNTYIISLA